MKKKLFGIAALCVLLASAPFLTSRKTESFKAVPAMNVSESGKKNAGTAGQAAALYRDEYTDETLKAIIIILNSNNKAGAGFRKKSIAKTEFIKTQKNGKKIYSKLELFAEKLEEKTLTYKDKNVPIPYFYTSRGFVQGNKKYPYIRKTACPWDRLSKNASNKTTGISLNALNELCRQGLSCREALRRFISS